MVVVSSEMGVLKQLKREVAIERKKLIFQLYNINQ